MSSVLQEIIQILVSGITQLASGIGSGLKSLVEAIFLDTSGTSPVLSSFGGVVIVFAGIALAIGLMYRSIKTGQNRWKSRTDNTEINLQIA